MDCNEARALLDADIDRELPATEAQRIRAHLAVCATCRETSEAIASLSRAARAAPYHRASPALRARIVEALPAIEASDDRVQAAQDARAALGNASPDSAHPTRPEENAAAGRDRDDERPEAFPHGHDSGRRGGRSSDGSWRRTLRDWLRGLGFDAGAGPAAARRGSVATLGLRGTLALVLACALTAGVVLTLTRPTPSSALVDAFVASHVRAQLSGHDIDVVSSDQHTVKPWFNGRLDYAPPVEDLAASGFALTGGRLDYVDHRRVAVLVYRYRKHIIDVYVQPDAGRAAAQPTMALVRDGYAIECWHDAGMTWWAVSDAEAGVLAQLRTALSERLHGAPAAPEPQS